VVDAKDLIGCPEITQVVASRVAQLGNAVVPDFTAHWVMAKP